MIHLFSSYSSKTDEELMTLLQDGSHRAFSEIYKRYASSLKGYFYKMLWNNHEEAEDAVHDLFSKIIDRPHLFKTDYLFKPWVFRVASNICKNKYRKWDFEKAYRSQLTDDEQYFSGIEKKIDNEKSLNEVNRKLDQMDPDKKSIFLLRYQQDFSIKELSELFEISEGTVKSRLHYIKAEVTKGFPSELSQNN